MEGSLLKAFVKWLISLFKSSHRVQVVQLAEEAAALGTNAMKALKDCQSEQVKLWNQLKTLKEGTDKEIDDLKAAEKECLERYAELAERIKYLENGNR